MPWTIYRYILREVLAILGLSLAVLVTVLSFFIALKPLSEGLLDGMALVKFVLYTIPTVLAFALPFAGAFASTLVFLRLAGDNEITACAASGISYFRVLLPIIALGLVLMGLLLYMSNFVIPGYYKKAARTAQSDALTMIESQLNRGEPVTFDRFVLYAESAESVPPSQINTAAYAIPPQKLISLTRVVFGQYDEQGKMRWDYTAGRASALLFRQGDRSWVTIRLRDSVYYDPTLGQMQRAQVDPLDLGPISPPNPLEDDPRFMSYRDLNRLERHPERFDDVAEGMRRLRIELGREVLVDRFRAAASGAGLELIGPGDGEVFRVSAGSVERSERGLRLTASADRPVQVIHERRGSRVWRVEAPAAMVQLEAAEFDDQPGVLMELSEAKAYDPGPDPVFTEHPVLNLPRMRWPGELIVMPEQSATAKASPAFALLEMAEQPGFASNPDVIERAKYLWSRIYKLGLDIVAQRHERAATAAASFLLVVLGATLSIYLRNQMTLVVYFWSFVLAIVALVMIHSGSRLVSDDRLMPAAGMAVLWSANIGLAVVTGWVYCRFARN